MMLQSPKIAKKLHWPDYGDLLCAGSIPKIMDVGKAPNVKNTKD